INAINEKTRFTRDPLGRVLSEIAPDAAVTGFGWDQSGNLTSLVPPGRPAHGLSYTPVQLQEQYAPPPLASLPDGRTIYEYNALRKLERVTRPDGKVLAYAYDLAGRLANIWTPDEIASYAYYDSTVCTGCAPGKVRSLALTSGETLSFGYDGILLTST